MTRSLRRRLGYTITEMMIATAIVATVSSIGATLMIRLQNFYLTTTARNDIQRDARGALDIINRQLRQAVSTSIQIDSPANQGYYSRISFNSVDGRAMKFYQNGNQLIAYSTTTTAVLSNNLYYLAFSFPDSQNPTIVNVSMTMFKNIQLGRRSVLQMSIQKVRVMN
jgi:prepilin-type N-terminal cleavage/methylation domain-containing protein